MKIQTKLKIKEYKRKAINKWYELVKPLARLEEGIYDKKLKKKRIDSNYNKDKIKKLLYKSIQNELIYEEDIYIFDVGWISDEDSSSNFMLLWDLFRNRVRSKNEYLKNYYYYVKDKSLKHDDFWEIIKTFDGDEFKVKEVNKEDVFTWDYARYSGLYKNSNKILQIKRN